MSEIGKPLGYPIITGPPVKPIQPGKTGTTKPVQDRQSGPSFGDLLQRTLEQQTGTQTRELTFSKHAQTRTESRGIQLSETDIDRLTQAVGKAEDKGVTETLVLMNNTAFIVNVPNKVVVTVVDGSESEEEPNVFTNIDGAVIL